MAKTREASVVSGTHQVRRLEPDVRIENIVKGVFVEKFGQPSFKPGTHNARNTDAEAHTINNDNSLTSANGVVRAAPTDPSPEPPLRMYRVSDWDAIMTEIDIDSLTVTADLLLKKGYPSPDTIVLQRVLHLLTPLVITIKLSSRSGRMRMVTVTLPCSYYFVRAVEVILSHP